MGDLTDSANYKFILPAHYHYRMSGLFYYKNTVSIDKYPMRVYIYSIYIILFFCTSFSSAGPLLRLFYISNIFICKFMDDEKLPVLYIWDKGVGGAIKKIENNGLLRLLL